MDNSSLPLEVEPDTRVTVPLESLTIDELEANIRQLSQTSNPENFRLIAQNQQALGILQLQLYFEKQDEQDLSRSITNLCDALKGFDVSDSSTAIAHYKLGVAYFSRFQLHTDPEDLQLSIHQVESAVAALPSCEAKWLHSLALGYRARSEISRSTADVELFLKYQQEAVDRIPDDAPVMSQYKHILGLAYRDRYMKLGNPEDLDKFLLLQKEAIGSASSDDPQLAVYQQFLGLGHRERFERSCDIEDLNLSIELQKEAIQKLPEDYPELAEYLNSLGISYLFRLRALSDMEDLQMFLTCEQLSVSKTPAGHNKMSMRQKNLALAFSECYQRTGKHEFQDLFIKHLHEALNACNNSEEIHTFNHNLGTAYLDCAQISGVTEDFETALRLQQLALKMIPSTHPDVANYHRCLGMTYAVCFEKQGNIEYLNMTAFHLQQAIEKLPPGHAHMQMCLYNLGTAHEKLSEVSGGIEHINMAIENIQKAIDCIHVADVDLPLYQQNLGLAYGHRYTSLGRMEDLHMFIKCSKEAVAGTPEGDPELPSRLHSLGFAYHKLFQAVGDVADLDSSIVVKQRAIDSASGNKWELCEYKSSLGTSYLSKFKTFGRLEDLELSVKYRQEAVDDTPSHHPAMAFHKNSLGLSYLAQFQRLGKVEDLNIAINYFQTGVDETDPLHKDLPHHQRSLGVAYRERFRHLGHIEDLQLSIKLQTMALEKIPETHSESTQYHHNLGVAHIEYFQKLGEVQNIESAIHHLELAVKRTPDGHPGKSHCLHDLGIAYHERFKRLGAIQDLEMAIHNSKESVNCIPDGDPNVAHYHQSLGLAYGDRYQRLGDIEDLKLFLSYEKGAVNRTKNDHPHMPQFKHSLAYAYSHYFQRLGRVEDLEMSLKYQQESLDGTPQGHPTWAARQENLAVAYFKRHSKLGRISDLDTCISLLEIAVNKTSENDFRLSSCLQTLSISYYNRYEKLDNHVDLSMASQTIQKAIHGTVSDHVGLCSYQLTLANCYLKEYEYSQDVEYLYCALHYFRTASQSKTASPEDIFSVACSWANTAYKMKLPECLEAYLIVFSTIPTLVWLGNSISVRQQSLSQYDFASLASKAVVAAIKFGQLDTAVEFLEQSQTVTYQQLMHFRESFDVLTESHPELGRQLKLLAQKLQESASASISQDVSATEFKFSNITIEEHRGDVLKWDRVVAEIRQLRGFEHFMMPVPYKALCLSASNGPILMISSDEEGSNALIITAADLPVLHVNLPNASEDQIIAQIIKLHRCLAVSGNRAREVGAERGGHLIVSKRVATEAIIEDILTWIWAQIVQPVISCLQENGILSGRIWWCPIGPLKFLPIHAALQLQMQIIPSSGSISAVLVNGYIQSYTTSLSALQKSRESALKRVSEPSIVTIVGVSGTGGHSFLPFITREIHNIEHIVGRDRVAALINEEASVANVSKTIGSLSSWLHLACHGEQDGEKPLQSSLILHDGKLYLQDLMKRPLEHAEFVFLSACQTALGDIKLRNESMHLAGGMLFAGFKGAVGTLWAIVDEDGPAVAESFYKHLFEDGKIPNVFKAAEALQVSTNKLRSEGVPLQRWVPFIHIGV